MQEGAPPKFITMIEPTYRLEPGADKMFNVDTAKGIIKEVLEAIFVEEKYAPEDLREKVIEANNAVGLLLQLPEGCSLPEAAEPSTSLSHDLTDPSPLSHPLLPCADSNEACGVRGLEKVQDCSQRVQWDHGRPRYAHRVAMPVEP